MDSSRRFLQRFHTGSIGALLESSSLSMRFLGGPGMYPSKKACSGFRGIWLDVGHT